MYQLYSWYRYLQALTPRFRPIREAFLLLYHFHLSLLYNTIPGFSIQLVDQRVIKNDTKHGASDEDGEETTAPPTGEIIFRSSSICSRHTLASMPESNSDERHLTLAFQIVFPALNITWWSVFYLWCILWRCCVLIGGWSNDCRS